MVLVPPRTRSTDRRGNLARHGFVVLTYSARGFGASGGSIHLDALKYEVADASKLVDYLQARPEVEKRAGRPVIGVAGSSYGGALALMLGATDHRIGAVAADITWNDLSTALFPNDSAGTSGQPGVFKKLWAGYLFSAGFSAATAASADPAGTPADTQCGRFSADVCALYQRVAGGGELDAASHSLLLQSSPTTVLSGMTAPTLLIQGEQDSLFGLEQADANARQLTAAGVGLQVRWRGGGHDATDSSDDVDGWERSFLTDHLSAAAAAAAAGAATGSTGTVPFDITERDSGLSASTGRTVDTKLRVDTGYPSAAAVAAGTTPHQTVTIAGPPQTISAPAGGSPAAVSSIPGLGGVLGAAAAVGSTAITGLSGLPGQTALFSSERLPESVLITGSSQVRAAGAFDQRHRAVRVVARCRRRWHRHVAQPVGGTVPATRLAVGHRGSAQPAVRGLPRGGRASAGGGRVSHRLRLQPSRRAGDLHGGVGLPRPARSSCRRW